MKVAISLGGSVVGFPPDIEYLKKFRSLVEEFRRDIVGIVVGGSPLAREMIAAAKKFGVSKDVLDAIGVQATMMNAWIVRSALDGLVLEHPIQTYFFNFPLPPEDRIPVYGGSPLPGLTTDFVAALLAEHHGASFLNITRVGGIYDRDPEKYPDAKLIRKTTYREVEDLVLSSDRREPGTNFPIDVAAFNILRRSRIHTYVVGPDVENIRSLLSGREWRGTEIVP